MAKTEDRYVRVKQKNKSGYTVTKWKDTKTGKIVDTIPFGANVKPTGGELGVSTLSEQVKTDTAKRQKEFITSNRDRSSGIIGGVTPDQDLISQAMRREEEFKNRQAYPATLPTSDAEFQMAQFNMNMQENLSTLAMQGQISMSQAMKLSKMNGGAFETFNNMSYKAEVGQNPSVFAEAIKAQAPQPPTAPEPTPDWDDNEGDRDVGVKSKDDIWLEDTANSPAAQAGMSDKLRLQARENTQRFRRERQASKEARKAAKKETRNVTSDAENKQLEQGF